VGQKGSLVSSGDQARSQQVPILKFLDSQNQDGSYTYGYEVGEGWGGFEGKEKTLSVFK
jgi:hypothetical protein